MLYIVNRVDIYVKSINGRGNIRLNKSYVRKKEKNTDTSKNAQLDLYRNHNNIICSAQKQIQNELEFCGESHTQNYANDTKSIIMQNEHSEQSIHVST